MNARGSLLLYDLSDPGSTKHLASYWLNMIRRDDPGLPIVLVGNKLDLVEESSCVVEDLIGIEFMGPHGLSGHIKASSKTGENVEKAFQLLTRKILEKSGINP